MPASSLLNSWNVPAMIVPGKLGLSQAKVKVLAFARAVAGFLGFALAGAVVAGSFPLPITTMCAGTVTLMVAVKRLAGVRTDVGEFQPLHRAVVGAFERAFVFEVKAGARILCDAAGERDTHRRILRVALRSEGLVAGVREFRDAQRVVQLKRRHAEVFERRNLYGSARRELVRLR